MTYVNVTVDRASDIRERQRVDALKNEMEFWKAEAERLHQTLENIFDRAVAGEDTELYQRGVTVIVCTKKIPALPIE
jgi:hypothetical protein